MKKKIRSVVLALVFIFAIVGIVWGPGRILFYDLPHMLSGEIGFSAFLNDFAIFILSVGVFLLGPFDDMK